ncbi:hypothetical protein [Streptomyces beihaiensis]|uniref:Uncharacterized protein n=1 Tax=Streptomyces beihaiensis TaxID=2984495 RepID=A0ABT3U5T2_9ACTN|nr:hypothetical protein [Streptomyces beihaiensis]MCX3063538.1 hypothetical protein [Streptomyces beihaiensis]
MTRPPTAAQRRIIEAADPETGRITGSESQLSRLVALKLAFRHPRPPHDHFLTPAGHRVREAPASEPQAAVSASSSGGVFAARLGGEPDVDLSPARAREVRTAWQGLLEMRRMTGPDGSTDRPCAWERGHLAQAAALALEAAGCAPAGTDSPGYRVSDTAQPEAVAVRHPDPAALALCAQTLGEAGWQVSEHAERRGGGRFLLASPRRA